MAVGAVLGALLWGAVVYFYLPQYWDFRKPGSTFYEVEWEYSVRFLLLWSVPGAAVGAILGAFTGFKLDQLLGKEF